MPRIELLPAFARAWALFAEDPLRLVGITLVASLIAGTVVLAPVMVAGSFFVLGRMSRGETPLLSDLFAPFGNFERFLMGSLMWLGAQVVGLVLLGWNPPLGIAVGLVINAFFLLFMPLMVQRGLDAMAAFRACREHFQREWLMLLVLAGLLTVLIWVGALALLLGLIITLPYALAVIQAVYEQLYGRGRPEAAPAADAAPAGGEAA
jgi:hypothetical protein